MATVGWTEMDLKRVGWQSESWPAVADLEMKSTTTAWMALREHIDSIRGYLESFDTAAVGIDADRSLTELGKTQKAQPIAKLALSYCENPKAFAKVEEQVTRQIENLQMMMTGIPQAPEDPVTAMMMAEIRAHLASEPQAKRLAKARSLLTDKRVCSAIFNAPSFLSGMSDDEHKLLRTEAEQVLHPAERKARDELVEALNVAREASRMATNKVAQRAKLAKAPSGEWVPTTNTPVMPLGRPSTVPVNHQPSQVA